MSDKISILLPTRRRINAFTNFYNSIKETAEEFPEIVAYTDNDDQEMYGFLCGLGDVQVINAPRIILSQMWNECYRVATGNILMMAGDDLVFRTPGWDRMVKETFDSCPDKILFIHGDDGIVNFGSHGFLHRRWIETVGYITPPYFSCDFCDVWLQDVSNALNRRVHLPFMADHMHPVHGKAPWDETHIERIERGKRDNVEAIYNSLTDKRREDVEKLRNVCDERWERLKTL